MEGFAQTVGCYREKESDVYKPSNSINGDLDRFIEKIEEILMLVRVRVSEELLMNSVQLIPIADNQDCSPFVRVEQERVGTSNSSEMVDAPSTFPTEPKVATKELVNPVTNQNA